MMRSSRLGAGTMLRQVVSAKDPFSLAAPSSPPRAAAADIRPLTAPSPLPPPASGAAPLLSTDWEAVHHGDCEAAAEQQEEEEEDFWFFDAAPAPSPDELQAAICNLQQMSIPSPYPQQRYHDDQHSNSDSADGEINSPPRTSLSTEPQSDWIEPSFHACSQLSSPNNCHKAFQAFHLLKVNPSIQKMVFSLSSDKAVWDAVMKNEAVQEIKKSLRQGIADAKTSDNRGPVECIVSALGGIYSSTKTTVMELIDKVTTFVSNLVHSPEKKGDEESEFFADAVKSSLMLSVFVFLIVIVGRLQK